MGFYEEQMKKRAAALQGLTGSIIGAAKTTISNIPGKQGNENSPQESNVQNSGQVTQNEEKANFANKHAIENINFYNKQMTDIQKAIPYTKPDIRNADLDKMPVQEIVEKYFGYNKKGDPNEQRKK